MSQITKQSSSSVNTLKSNKCNWIYQSQIKTNKMEHNAYKNFKKCNNFQAFLVNQMSAVSLIMTWMPAH